MREPVSFHDKVCFIMVTEERADGHAWSVLSAAEVMLASGDKLPSDADARAAVINCTGQLCGVLSEGLRNA